MNFRNPKNWDLARSLGEKDKHSDSIGVTELKDNFLTWYALSHCYDILYIIGL